MLTKQKNCTIIIKNRSNRFIILAERDEHIMGDLRENWKETGVGLGHAFKNLGKSIVKSVKVGVVKADEWANGDDNEKTEDAANETKGDGVSAQDTEKTESEEK